MSITILAAIKILFDFSNYSAKSKYYDSSNTLVIVKVKDKTGGLAIEEFVVLKPKMYSFLVENNEHKNAVATVSHNEYKDVLLNKKCIRHSMSRIQSGDCRIGT